MMMGGRRFVNLVAETIKSRVLSVHRLDASENLFYPSATAAAAAAKKASTLMALPPPVTSFQSMPGSHTDQLFALVNPRISDSRILWNDPSDHTNLYDIKSHSTCVMPSLSCKGYGSVAISVACRPDAPEEDLYVLSNNGTFQVLRFGHPKVNQPNLPEGWQLETLPSPPLPVGARIFSHAVFHGGHTICVTVMVVNGRTTNTYATYIFDTVERKWRKAADGCNLPFSSRVEYDPNLKLWLGLCTSHRQLCVSDDLSAAIDKGKPPTVKQQWEVVEMPEGWLPFKGDVINLGGGRFCVFKVIDDVVRCTDGYDEWDDVRKQLALLTGVEIIKEEAGLVRMVAHKTLSYIFTKYSIEWVL